MKREVWAGNDFPCIDVDSLGSPPGKELKGNLKAAEDYFLSLPISRCTTTFEGRLLIIQLKFKVFVEIPVHTGGPGPARDAAGAAGAREGRRRCPHSIGYNGPANSTAPKPPPQD